MRHISAKLLRRGLALSLLAVFSVAADCVTVPSGLVDLWSGDSARGPIAPNPGSFRGGGKIGSGYAGAGFVFNGGADALQLPASFQMPAQDFTIEAWVKRANPDSVGSDFEGGEFFAGNTNAITFGMTHTGVLYCGKVGLVNFYSTTSIRDTNWHHVALTHAANALNFYADGILITTASTPTVFDQNGPYAIGGLGAAYGAYYGFNGRIDEVAAYGRALAANEIAAIYAAGTAGKCALTPLVETIPVLNPSFEALSGSDTNHFDAEGHLLDGHFSAYGLESGAGVGFNLVDAVPGWTIHDTAGSAGTFNTPPNLLPGGMPDGENTAWINVVGYFSQSLTNVYQVGRRYELTVDVGALAGVQFPGYFVGLFANGQPVIATTNSPAIPAGGFIPVTLTGVIPADSSAIGAPIEIRIGIPGSSGGQVDFDAVRLTKVSLGENIALNASAPGTVQPDTDFTATFTVANNGTQAATNVELNVTLPAGFTLVTNTLSQGTNVIVTNVVHSALGNLEAGSAVIFTLTGHGAAPTNLVFHGAVTRDGDDLTLTDNQADVSVEVLGPCVTAPGGLVLWMRGEGGAADEFSHAVAPAGVSSGSGKVGRSLFFDGFSEVAINDSPDLDQSSFTIETWVYPTAVDGTVDIIANKETAFPNLLSDIQFELGIKGPINDVASEIPVGNLSFFLSGITGLPNNYGGWTDAKASIPLNQWTHVALTVTNGTVVAYVNGTASLTVTNLTGAPVMNNWPLKLGSRATQYVNNVHPQDRFNGSIDEFSYYGRALSGAEISAVYQAGGAGKCVQTFPVAILAPPVDVTTPAGKNATFSVVATGTGPLTYQWKFKGVDIAGATNATLVVPAPRKSAIGTYSVSVCNMAGCAADVSANLTVTPVAALVSVVNTTTQSPNAAVVPVRLIGNGVENALSFSLRFDTNRLTYLNIDLGADAADGQLLVNSAQAAKGILSIVLALPAGSVFADGTNEVLNVSFGTPLLSLGIAAPVSFTDNPTLRKISDANGNVLPANWSGGQVVITPADFEGDVTPVPAGDKQVDITDWVQVGRYVAGLADLAPGAGFQRADCAPLATAGNGVLSVSDWVQAGRFAVGLDEIVPAGGPTGPIAGAPGRKHPVLQATPDRVVSFGSAALVAGLTQEVPVMITATGEENAVAFSVNYDPTVLKLVGAVKGAGSKSAQFNVNTRHAASGEVGVALALTTGAKFAAGTVEIARLQFMALTGGGTSTNLAFTDAPVVREVASPLAETLSVAWQASSFSVTLPSVNARPVQTTDGPAIELSWSTTLTGATLEQSDSLGATWSPVSLAPTVSNGQNRVVVPLSAASAYFHVKLP